MSDLEAERAAWLEVLEERLTGRVTRLEAEVRRRQRTTNLLVTGLVASLVLSGVALFGSGFSGPGAGDEIRAQRFVLEGDDGTLRGRWQLDDDGSVRLSIMDAAGRPRMNLSVLEDGSPGISFADEEDRRRVVLGLLPDRTGTLVFADDLGVPRAVLGVSRQGSATLLFADGEGMSRVSLGLDPSGAASLILPDVGQESSEEDPTQGNER